MIKLRIDGDKIGELTEFLSSCSTDEENICRASVTKEIGGGKVGFFVYEGLYLRIQHTVSCSVFLYQNELQSCEIIAVGSGGATALGITWGTQKDFEQKIAKHIQEFAEEAGMKSHLLS